MDYILELFEAKKVEFKDDSVLGPCMNSGWSKLVKYYDKTSDSPAHPPSVARWVRFNRTTTRIWDK